MKTLADMYSFSSKLWYDKRWVSKAGTASLYLQVTLNGKHDEFPLKLRWPVGRIDLVKGCLLPTCKGDPEVNDYNLLVMMEQSKHTEIIRTYRIKKKAIDLVTFRRELSVFNTKESFISYIYRQSKFRYDTKDISKRTYQNVQSTIQQMLIFDASWPFEILDINWMKRFKRKLIAMGFEPGGIWTTLKNVKSYLKLASKEPLIYVNEDVVEFPNPEPEWRTIFLTKQEVASLMKLLTEDTLSFNQRRCLNAFLFQCFTSLRVSDLYRVNAKWQLTEGFLYFIPKKNEKAKRWIEIAIMPMANTFIKNVLGNYFDLPNEAEYNLQLKALAKKAGINKHLTSHVGRHTFGHLYITLVGNLKGLKENLGHKKIATTDRYAHLDNEFKTNAVMKIQDEFSKHLMWPVKKQGPAD